MPHAESALLTDLHALHAILHVPEESLVGVDDRQPACQVGYVVGVDVDGEGGPVELVLPRPVVLLEECYRNAPADEGLGKASTWGKGMHFTVTTAFLES